MHAVENEDKTQKSIENAENICWTRPLPDFPGSAVYG